MFRSFLTDGGLLSQKFRYVGLIIISSACGNPLGDSQSTQVNFNPAEEFNEHDVPEIIGLEDDLDGTPTKVWNWSCTHERCRYRFNLSTEETGLPSGEYQSVTNATASGSDGIWYLHIQASSLTSVESDPMSVRVLIDGTTPTFPTSSTVDLGVDATESQTPTMTWAEAEDTNQITYFAAVSGDIGDAAGCNDEVFAASSQNATWYQVPEDVNPVTGWALEDGALDGLSTVMEVSLGDGTYCTAIRAVDSAGNITTIYSNSWTLFTNGVLGEGATPVVTGLSNDTTSGLSSKTWTWGCDMTSCEFRFDVTTSSTPNLTGAYGSGTTTTANTQDGTIYLHVQARSAAGIESEVVSVSVTVDAVAPVFGGSSLTFAADDSLSWRSPNFVWAAATDTNTLSYAIAIAPDSGTSGCDSSDFSSTLTLSWTNMPSGTSFSSSGWRLVNGEKDGDSNTISLTLTSQDYCAAVRAQDTPGNESFLYSSAFQPFIATSVSGLVAWWDASAPNSLYTDSSCSTLVSSNSDTIACWVDKSTSGYNATTTNSSEEPTYVESALNGLPGVRFSGSHVLTIASGNAGPFHDIGTSEFGMFFVVRINSTGSAHQVISSHDTIGFEFGAEAANTISGHVSNTGIMSTSMATGSTFHLYYIYRTSSTVVIGQDQSSSSSFTRAGSLTSNKETYFGQDSGSGSEFLDGDIMEVILYNGVPSNAELTTIATYIENKWGVDAAP